MVIKQDLAVLFLALLAVLGLTTSILAMSTPTTRPANVQLAAVSCVNGQTCTADSDCTGGVCVVPQIGAPTNQCEITHEYCTSDSNCPLVAQTCVLQPGMPAGQCQYSKNPCQSDAECMPTTQTCVLPPAGSCQQCSGSATCGNGTCDVSGNETNVSCPSDCKKISVDPTHNVGGTVARLFSDDVYNGGEKWFVDANGVETHDGPYPPGSLTVNGHGYPMNIPGSAAVGSGRIELRSANVSGNYVEAYVPFTVDSSTPTAVCGNAICEAGEDALKCPMDCTGGQCQEGAPCGPGTNMNCGTGTCVSKPGSCASSKTACTTSNDCPLIQSTCNAPSINLCNYGSIIGSGCFADKDCVDPKLGQGLCLTTGSCSLGGNGLVCHSDADCANIHDSCLTANSCSCGPVVIDTDKDGVVDTADLCPNTPAGEAVDTNGCSDSQVDADGDGVCNQSAVSAGPSVCTGKDECEAVKGKVEFKGCPAALRVSVQLVDTQAKNKMDQALPTRIYDASAGSCASTIGTNTPLNYGNIFTSCQSENTITLNETNSINRLVADLITFGVTTGPKFVLVQSPVSSNGSVDYQAFNVSVSSGKTYNLGFEITPATSSTFVENSYFTKDSNGIYHGSRKQTITGSILEILSPDFSLWTSDQQIYPFVLSSDSDWTVDVCLNAPDGYQVLGGTNCSQVIVANELKVIEFTVKDVGSPEPNLTAKITTTHKGKKTVLKNDLEGFRVKSKSQNAQR